jgi:hypothetical protein
VLRAASSAATPGLVIAINVEIESDEARHSTVSDGLLIRLEKWIAKLREKLADIARALGAVSFATTVGALVTVNVTWPPEPGAGGAAAALGATRR